MPSGWVKGIGMGGVLVVCTPLLAWAAEQPKSAEGTDHTLTQRVQAFADKLGLDQAAHAKVQEIAERYSLSRQQVRDELTQRMRQLREEETQAIKAVLTPKQRDQYDQMLSQTKPQSDPSTVKRPN